MQSVIYVLQNSVAAALTELKIPVPTELHFEHPASSEFGDYSSNIAMVILGKKKQDESTVKNTSVSTYKSPRELAEAIVRALQHQQKQSQNSDIQRITVAGPGFINFTFSDTFLIQQATRLTQDPRKSIENVGQGKPVVVEYSSPNIAKPFTIGHLRSTIIGDAVANLLEATGYHVFRDNHLGDWGTQFGKQIYAIKEWGSEAELDKSAEPVKDLVALYIKFHQEAEQKPELEEEGRKWFKKLEEGDPEARRLWQKCIDWSLKEFQRIYQTLGVQFTENGGKGYGESFFEDKMGDVIAELKEKKLLTNSEGAQMVFFPVDKYPPLMIIKKDGATLYATRDLATDKFRLKQYGTNVKVINEVGAEQSLYFQQLYELEQMLGWYKAGQRVHVKHGHFRFNDQKMSTRKGNVIWLNDVLVEAEKRAAALTQAKSVVRGQKKLEKNEVAVEIMPATNAAAIIGIGALKWNDLKRSSVLEVVFDWNEMLALQGNSGPYLQYTFARCNSVLTKAAQTGKNGEKAALSDYHLNEEEKAVLRLLYRFNEVIQQATTELAPHHLANYLFELAQSFNAFYNKNSILGQGNNSTDQVAAQPNTVQLRLLLTQATADVIQKGLTLLGIQTLEKM